MENMLYYQYRIYQELQRMGQSYCVRLCGENDQNMQNILSHLVNEEADEPNSKFAKKVKQHIELHSKIKAIYLQYRTPHHAEKLGVHLELYYLFQFGAYYEGQWKNGLPNGFGRVIYDDGSVYEGCFHQGIADCHEALFIKYDGSFYRGNIKNNRACGYGQLSAYKIFYKGYWKNDLPNGKAREIYSTASFFQGTFVDGVKEGYGIYQWSLDDFYKGMFHFNRIEGKGELTTKEYTYSGNFRNGKKDGQGKYIDHSCKFTYDGCFENNQPKGYGEIIYKDGTIFIGTFAGFQKRRGKLKFLTGEEHQIDTFAKQQQSIQIIENSQSQTNI